MNKKQKLIFIGLCSFLVIPIFGAYQLSNIIAHAQTNFSIPEIKTTGDKQDQAIQLQKQQNKELAIIICTDYRAQRIFGQPDSFANYQWTQSDYDCIKKVLESTK